MSPLYIDRVLTSNQKNVFAKLTALKQKIMSSCLFCKIVNKELSSEIVYENENLLVFKDIHPKADFHILIVPKKHIESVNKLQPKDKDLIIEMFLVVKEIAKQNQLKGYKLAINVGRKGGQLIDHLHLHLLAGRVKEIV